ncbi:MAG TPA: hypothetical protein VGE05_06780 [Novosphingobium sp.]
MRGIGSMAGAIGLALTPVASLAATPESCAAPAPLAGGWEAWGRPAPLAADGAIEVGGAVRLSLRPAAQVAFATPPGKSGGADSFGGTAHFRIVRAGTYRIGLSAGAWIDVVAAGKPLASTAHGHGPECSGIRKIVDFALTPGDYVIQLAASPLRQVTLLVIAE